MKDALTIHRALLGWEAAHKIVRLPVALAHADELPKALALPADHCLVTRVYSCDPNPSPSPNPRLALELEPSLDLAPNPRLAPDPEPRLDLEPGLEPKPGLEPGLEPKPGLEPSLESESEPGRGRDSDSRPGRGLGYVRAHGSARILDRSRGGLGDGGRPGRAFLVGVIVAAGERPPLDVVRRAVGAEIVRPARPGVVNAVTEYAAGLVCPLLLPDDMPLLIDRRVVDGLPADDVVYTATGEASTALGIRGRTLYDLCGAKPADLFPSPSATTARANAQGPRHQVA
ncbi:hypothetical protein OHR68_38740 [Spirillospora sp. NBC_00431]